MSDDRTRDGDDPVPPPDPPADLDGAATLAPSADAPTADRPQPPGYEILGELGRGGMGVVYKARQRALNRIVALKMILSGGHAGPDALARFRSEAESVARLQHPGIVQVYEVGEHGGLPYFSLEFVEGGSLDQKLAGTPQPPRQAAELVRTLALAVHAAHQKGVVHRDLKPANVLLTADGSPKITDFGLAKQVGSDAGQTRSGAILGTPSYMAPEQAAGKIKEVGPAADIYALGAILYECLTGRPPFRAATPLDTVLQVVSEEPVAPTQFQPRLPRDLETICLQCLRKEPKKRYATAQELADELGRFLDGDPILARPVSWPERALRWVRKNPGKAVSLAAAVFVVGFVIAVQYAANRKERERAEAIEQARDQATEALADARLRKTEAERSAEEARQARNQAVTAKQDAQGARDAAVDQLYAARINLAYREWQQGNVYRTEQLLNESPARLRGWEWDYLRGLCRADKRTLKGHLEAVERVAVAPDGAHLLSSGASEARYWDLTTAQEIQSHPGGGPIAISPDGTRLAIASGRALRMFDEHDGRELLVLLGMPGQVIALAFTDAGQQLMAVTFEDHAVHRWDAVTGQPLGTVPLTGALSRLSGVARYWPTLSADGRRLAECHDGGPVSIWDTTTGKRQALLVEAPLMHTTRTAFGPRGDRLAACWAEGTVIVWELPSGKVLRRWRAHQGSVNCLAFSPDGRRLATGSQDQSIRVWDLRSFEELLTIRGHTGEVLSLAFTPDGQDLVSGSADQSIKVWDLAERRFFGGQRYFHVFGLLLRGESIGLPPGSLGYRTFYGHIGPTMTAAFSPDGRLIATVGNGDGQVIVWDLATNRVRHSFAIAPGAWLSSLAFGPDGKLLFALTSGGRGAEVHLWDLASGRSLLSRKGPAADQAGVVFLPDGKTVVVALTHHRSTHLTWWEVTSGREAGSLDLDGERVHSLDLSPDGKYLVAGSEERVTVLNPVARRAVRAFKVPASSALAVGRGGLVASAEGTLIRLYDLATGRRVRELEGHAGSVLSLAFSPDARRLVSAGSEQAVKIWDVATGHELLTFREHVREITRVAWSPDGRKLASVSWDHSLRVWEAAPDPVKATDRWPRLFVDHFDRPRPGPAWGTGAIEGGALRGTLVDTSSQNGWDKFEAASLTLAGVRLPETVEVRCECWVPQPLTCEVTLLNLRTGLSIHSLLIGLPQPFGFTGSALLLMRGGGNGSGALVGVPRKHFQFLPGRHYHLRVLRERTRLTFTVDGETLFSEAIPAGPAPVLLLQGAWGRAGDRVYFAKLEVRAPEEAVREQKLRDRVEASFDRLKLRSLVEEEINKDRSLSDADRRLMQTHVQTLRENTEELRQACARVLATKATPEEETRALRQAEEAVRLWPLDLVGLHLLGSAQYRVGKCAEAEATLSQLLERHREQEGCSLPSALAVRAMARHVLKRPDAADDLRYARDMLWSERWSRDEATRSLIPQADALLGLPRPQGEAEAIKAVIFRSEQAGWQHNDLRAYLAAYTEDAQVTEARSETPAAWDVTLDRRRLEAVRKLAFPVSAAGDLRISYEDVRVRVDGDRADCRYLSTSTGKGIFHTWRVRGTLHKTAAGWKIERSRAWPVAEKRQSVVHFDAAYWKAKDAAVEQARKSGRPRQLAAALEQARHYAEAWALVRQLTQESGATGDDWALRSRVAFVLGEVDEARAAFRTGLARSPNLPPPWFLSRERRVLSVSDAAFGVDWSPDGRHLAAGGMDARLHVWDMNTGQEVHRLPGHLNWISGLAYHPDGRRVATGGSDHFIKLWDAVAGREVRTLRGHNGRLYRLAFDASGRRLVSASADQTARVWDVETGSEQYALGHPGEVLGAVFSPDGRSIATACRDGLVRTWDAASGQPLRTFRGHRGDVYRVAYSPDGKWLASVGGDATVCLWDAASGQLLHTLVGHRAAIETVAFSPNGRWLVSAGYDAEIRLWDAATGKLLEVLDGHTGSIFALVFRADGQRLASASGDGTVRIWDMTQR